MSETVSTAVPPAGAKASDSSTPASDAEDTLGVPRGKRLPPRSAHDAWAVPEEVMRSFVAKGQSYFFPDGTLAFVDRGRELATRSDNREVTRTFVAIAAARGWDTVEVQGSERFRREAWSQATERGIQVMGYEPTAAERELTSRTETEPASAVDTSERDPVRSQRPAERRPPRDRAIEGELLEHGSARYQHHADNDVSYFVALLTPDGKRTVWGVDLERALRESESQPSVGDRIELLQTGRKAVIVTTRSRDETGAEVTIDKTTHRNGWVVEKAGFLAERARAAATLRDPAVSSQHAVAQHPQLASSQVLVSVASELVARTALVPLDQERFVSGVREALAQRIERGEAWPEARLRAPVREAERSVNRGADLTR